MSGWRPVVRGVLVSCAADAGAVSAAQATVSTPGSCPGWSGSATVVSSPTCGPRPPEGRLRPAAVSAREAALGLFSRAWARASMSLVNARTRGRPAPWPEEAVALGLKQVGYRTLIRWDMDRRRFGPVGVADDRWLREATGRRSRSRSPSAGGGAGRGAQARPSRAGGDVVRQPDAGGTRCREMQESLRGPAGHGPSDQRKPPVRDGASPPDRLAGTLGPAARSRPPPCS